MQWPPWPQVGVDGYTEWIQLVADLTVSSLGSWQWAAGSVYYLLGLWSRLVSSMPYLKGDSPSLLETYVPRINQAYITSRCARLPIRVAQCLLHGTPAANVMSVRRAAVSGILAQSWGHFLQHMAPSVDVMSVDSAAASFVWSSGLNCCHRCRLDSVAAAVTGGSEDPLDNEEQVRWGCYVFASASAAELTTPVAA